MNTQDIIQQTADMVQEKFANEASGHDRRHIYRVRQNAKHIAQNEECDMFVVELGALLHDIADYKAHDGDEKIGWKVTRERLLSLQLPESTIQAVVHIVDSISFKGKNHDEGYKSIECQVVQDADRLDAIGAIGVARTFAFGAHRWAPMHTPDIAPNIEITKEQYINNKKWSTINHFYEKLLLLKDRMNTATGKKIAQHRHEYMQGFLDEFLAERDGLK